MSFFPQLPGLTFALAREIVFHEITNTMNVTVSLPDELCQEARHRAVNERKSLSGWLAALIRRELTTPSGEPEARKSLIEALTVPGMPKSFYEKELPLPDRKIPKHRELSF